MSTRITQQMTISTVLSDIQNVAARLSKTQQKMASGKELVLPSDDPALVARALDLRSELAGLRQYQRNAQYAQGWESVTETALAQIGDLTLRARDLVVAGASQTNDQGARNAMALEIDQLADSIKSAANAQYSGRYVFGGSQTQNAPYQLGANDAYAGNTSAIQQEIGPGVSVDINEVGVTVIGDTNNGLLETLRTIAADLRSGNLTALQGADLQALDAAHETVTTARARNGARGDRLERAIDRLGQLELTTTSLLSETEDADMAKTYVDFSMQQAVYQSALKAGAQVIQPSLIDFI